MPLDVAICQIIVAYFQDRIRVMPFLVRPEWITIVGGIIQMHINELIVAITQQAKSDREESNASFLLDRKVQCEVFQQLYDSLARNEFEDAQLKHQRFLREMHTATFDNCHFPLEDQRLKLLRNVMTSFSPSVSSAACESEALTRFSALTSVAPAAVRQRPRSSTPPIGVRPKALRSNIPSLADMMRQMLYSNVPVGVRPKVLRGHPVATPTLKPMRFA
ncbi:MAG: hypothetical protein Q8L78_00880 [Coxiellaceae bacterium]|nr:hypothetical protein [Coxiellaceae bacterium]